MGGKATNSRYEVDLPEPGPIIAPRLERGGGLWSMSAVDDPRQDLLGTREAQPHCRNRAWFVTLLGLSATRVGGLLGLDPGKISPGPGRTRHWAEARSPPSDLAVAAGQRASARQPGSRPSLDAILVSTTLRDSAFSLDGLSCSARPRGCSPLWPLICRRRSVSVWAVDKLMC